MNKSKVTYSLREELHAYVAAINNRWSSLDKRISLNHSHLVHHAKSITELRDLIKTPTGYVTRPEPLLPWIMFSVGTVTGIALSIIAAMVGQTW